MNIAQQHEHISEVPATTARDQEDNILQAYHWANIRADLGDITKIEPKLLNNFLVTASDFLNILCSLNWDGIGVAYDEEVNTLDAVLDCFDTQKRIELVFSSETVHIRLVSSHKVIDLGTCRRPYGVKRMVNWMISE